MSALSTAEDVSRRGFAHVSVVSGRTPRTSCSICGTKQNPLRYYLVSKSHECEGENQSLEEEHLMDLYAWIIIIFINSAVK